MNQQEKTLIKKLWCVDDCKTMHAWVEMVNEDFNVASKYESFMDGQKALNFLSHLNACDKLKQEFPDIIILDINMPIINGREFIYAYNNNFYHKIPETKIIIQTNNYIESDMITFLFFPFVVDYIVKPIHSDTIIKAILTQHLIHN